MAGLSRTLSSKSPDEGGWAAGLPDIVSYAEQIDPTQPASC